jgi:hypothetical protein
MLTAILGALGDILRVAVVALERFALLLEGTPLGPLWPIGFLVLFQVLAFVLSVFVWVWRGRVWPVACGYPMTTTRGSKHCGNKVFGEWNRCHLHRRRWRRATDSHVVDPTLRRWETIRRGVKVERTDLTGSGFVRRESNLIGILYRKGIARPPRDVLGLAPQLVRDYRQRFRELWAGFQQWRRGVRPAKKQSRQASASGLLPSVIHCTQFILLVLAVAFVAVIVAVLLRRVRPNDVTARVVAEYLSAFLFFLAGSAFRGGILGHRVKPRAWEPEAGWLPRAWKEATATFFIMLVTAWGYAAFNAVKSEIPGWLVAFAFLMMLTSNPRKGRRRRRAAW